MHQKLENKYILTDCMNILQRDLNAFKQGALSMDDYTKKFHEISICCTVNEADHKTINHY